MSINVGKIRQPCLKNQNRLLTHTIHKNQLKIYIKSLKVRLETVKILEESISSTFFDFYLNNIFQDMCPQASETKAKTNKWDYIKLKSFCTAKETINSLKSQPIKWKRIFSNDISNKGLVAKKYKNFYNSTTNKQLD